MQLSFSTLANIPMIEPGDDRVSVILQSLASSSQALADNDIIVIAQKIVSKAEDRYLWLDEIEPSEAAINLAKEVDKDPRYVQAVLQESTRVIRKKPGVLIVAHRLGFVHANAGIDQSNIQHPNRRERLLLLPKDPDGSAEKIRHAIKDRLKINIGVVINDSMGRAWRNGTLGLAIGVAGLTPLEDHIGGQDIFGRELLVTAVAAADEIAAGASLLMGQTQEKTPIVLLRGYSIKNPSNPHQRGISTLLRDPKTDLFR